MRKLSLLLMALTPMVVGAEESLDIEKPTFNEVMDIADKAGRRTCFEIFNYGAHLFLPAGEYALDVDGINEKEAFFGLCDAVTGKTKLVGLQSNEILPVFGTDSLIDAFKTSRGVGVRAEYTDDSKAITYFYDKDSSDSLVALRIPVETDEVEISGLVSGSVSIIRQIDGEVLAGESMRHELGDRIVFEIDAVEGWELVFELEDGRLRFDDVWIK